MLSCFYKPVYLAQLIVKEECGCLYLLRNRFLHIFIESRLLVVFLSVSLNGLNILLKGFLFVFSLTGLSVKNIYIFHIVYMCIHTHVI